MVWKSHASTRIGQGSSATVVFVIGFLKEGSYQRLARLKRLNRMDVLRLP